MGWLSGVMGSGGCEETYGVFPCSTTLPGTLVLMVMYGYCLLRGANVLSDGSEMLLEVLDPGLIGGLLLPVLGALPDALIIVVSGAFAPPEEAQDQVAVGVGTLAGSSIMLLTAAWGGSLLAGRCDLDEKKIAKSKTITRKWDLWNTGVTTDAFTCKQSQIMVGTVFTYGIIQIPALISIQEESTAALTGGIICLLTLAAYCAFQVMYPELQKRQMERARKAHYRMAAVRAVEGAAQEFGSLLLPNGEVNTDTVHRVFRLFDADGNGHIDQTELRALLMGLSVGKSNSGGLEEDISYWMSRFDHDDSGTIQYSEFEAELSSWVKEKHEEFKKAQEKKKSKDADKSALKEISVRKEGGKNQQKGGSNGQAEPLMGEHGEGKGGGEEADGEGGSGQQNGQQQEDEHEDEEKDGEEDKGSDDDSDGDDPDGGPKKNMSKGEIIKGASLKLLIGIAICAVISDPMVDAVSNFSKASGIPAFFTAFCVNPFASNAMELISSIRFAMKRKKKNISLTNSQIAGGVTMNNTMCLGLFLLVVWYKGLEWTYTSEVIATVGATIIVGLFNSTRTTIRAVYAIPALLIYPLSILFVYLGDYVFMWDGPPK